MLEFAIANLLCDEVSFEVPSSLGNWEFVRTYNYADLVREIDKGMCGNTYYVSLVGVGPTSSDADFRTACDEIIDICLVLSFLGARCVTPSGTTGQSEIKFIALGDSFVRSRSIVGFPVVKPASFAQFFSDWLSGIYPKFWSRRLRLQLCHWLSGLTCFTLEDIYLSAGVQMDIVKQLEKAASNNQNLTYFQGMKSASNRYSLTALSNNYKAMRNDLFHEGVLSGSNFKNKTKSECAVVVAETLNWLDSYILAVIGKSNSVQGLPRWKEIEIEQYLPSISVR